MSIQSKTDTGTKEQSRPQSKFHALNTPLCLTWPKHRGNQKYFTRICQRKSVGSCRNSKQSQLPHRLTPSNLSLGRLFWESTDTEIVSDLMSTRAEIESGTRNWDCLCPPREDLRFFDTEGKHPRFWGSLHFQFGTPRKLSLISGEIQALPQLCSARNLFPEPIRY